MRTFVLFLIFTFSHYLTQAQIDSSLFKKSTVSTTAKSLNMDAIYNRPFMLGTQQHVSLGGYVEGNWQHMATNGVSLGHQFQFRRMSLFMASSLSRHIKFLSELEFENDPEELMEGEKMEIDIEYAAIDVEINPLLNFRSGIILNPIGAFNQNHDGPKWEFVDRPIAMTQLLPATWNNAGAGFYGKQYKGQWMLGYEIYLSSGFDNSIIDNDKNKTYLPQSRHNAARMAYIPSGKPLFSTKIATRHNKVGEFGLSYMGQTYNAFMADGLQIDAPRRLDVFAFDFNMSLPKWNTNLVGECAYVKVQVPANILPTYGSEQFGAFLDIIQPVFKGRVMTWNNSVLNLACRLEYADWNLGTFRSSGTKIYDELWSVVPAISFRPTPQTVLRLNYRTLQQRDAIGNPPNISGGFSLGMSAYF